MGKWTPSYRDEVLGQKIKSLVGGAIKRATLEPGEPLITYDAFVDDLDTGDSFTASVLDILVKELAERRTRPSETDRRLVSLRTARSLSELGSSFPIYRELPRAQRSLNVSEYINDSAQEIPVIEDEEDDDFGSLLDAPTYSGAQALHEAFGAPTRYPRLPSRTLPPLRTLNPVSSFPEGSSSSYPPLPPLPPPPALPSFPVPNSFYPARLPPPPQAPRIFSRRASSATAGSSSSSSLTRQHSIRRTTRARANEFAEFSSRRRNELRASAAETAANADRNSWTPLFEPAADSPTSPTRAPSPPADWRAFGGVSASNSAADASVPPHEATSNTATLYLTPPATHSWPGSPSDEERAINRSQTPWDWAPGPRLRRGGLLAPEALISSRFPDVLDSIVPFGGSPGPGLSREPEP